MRCAALAVALSLLAAAVPATVAEAARPPVVMLVFDEFPTDVLLRPDGRIDSRRFPGFAALARRSTWFRNAHTVHDSTRGAAPAILTGRLPRRDVAPSYLNHPRSVFTLLDRHGYDIRSFEEATTICPRRLCRRTRTYGWPTPNILYRRAQRLRRTIRSLRRRERPTFTYHHSMLPHVPWAYLPSGRERQGVRPGVLPDFALPPGFADVFLTRHNQQRHLLQVGFVDRQIRLLLGRLKRLGLLDRSLLVVTADHGVAFEIGTRDRREVTATNLHEIAPVPLFVKRPRQRRGRRDGAYVRSIDVLPTIAALLRLPLEGPVDGASAFGARVRERSGVRMARRDLSGTIEATANEIESRRRDNVAQRAALFGTGRWSAVFRIGPHRELLGRRAVALPAEPAGGVAARFAVPRRLRRVDPRGRAVPTWAAGAVAGGGTGTRDLALAVNGRVRAVGRTFRLDGRAGEFFSLMYPESALRRGANTVELFEVRPGTALARLGAAR